MKTLCLVVALVLFLLAGISAAADSVNLNELAFLAFGLVAYVASYLIPDRLG